jgi:ubiquinol-cytochrome c reductase iron-sulfur subunit
VTPAPDDRAARLATAVAAVSFVLAILGAIAFVVVYVVTDADNEHQTQLLGTALLVAVTGLGVGLVTWARRLMPQGPHVEQRHAPHGDRDARSATDAYLESETGRIGRRPLLGRLLATGFGALGLASLAPLASLGPDPFPERTRTAWVPGRRLERVDGSQVHRDDLPVGGAIAVFPAGLEHAASDQTMLIRLAPDGPVPLTAGRGDRTAAGHVAYSRVCTHMGCPVGLYQVVERQLVCPCHQSAFDVVDGAAPLFGPATRALPQLQLGVDGAGFLIATDGFDRPVGPGYWSYPGDVEEGGA